MMLLQCPRFFRSPSRNQTPSTILVTVSGLASEFPAKKASVPSTPNAANIHTRTLFIIPPAEQNKCTFKPGANAMACMICWWLMADGLEARMDRVELNLERLVTVVSTMADQMVGFQNQ